MRRRTLAFIDAAVGVHPHHAAAIDEAGWAALERLADDRATRGDRRDRARLLPQPFAAGDVQRDAFERQLALAAERDRPCSSTTGTRTSDVTAALLAWAGRPGHDARGVLHAFSGDAAMAARLTRGRLPGLASRCRSPSAPRAGRARRHGFSGGRLPGRDRCPVARPGARARNEPTTALRVVAELARLRGTAARRASRRGPIGLRAADRLVERRARLGMPLAFAARGAVAGAPN